MMAPASNIFSMANWANMNVLANAFQRRVFGEHTLVAEETFKKAIKESNLPGTEQLHFTSPLEIASWIRAHPAVAKRALQKFPGISRFQPTARHALANQTKKKGPFDKAQAEIRKMKINEGQLVDWKTLKKNSSALSEKGQIRLVLELIKQLEAEEIHTKVKVHILEFFPEILPPLEKRLRLPVVMKVCETTINNEEEEVRIEAIKFLARTTPLLNPKECFVIAISLETRLWDDRLAVRQEALNALREIMPLLKTMDLLALAKQIERSIKGQKEAIFNYTHAAWGLIYAAAGLPMKHRLPRALTIEAFLTHPNPSMRFTAILTLPHFVELLEPRDRLPRVLAIEARLADDHPPNREDAAKGLIKVATLINKQEYLDLIERLKSRTDNLQAKKVLEGIPPPPTSVLDGLVPG